MPKSQKEISKEISEWMFSNPIKKISKEIRYSFNNKYMEQEVWNHLISKMKKQRNIIPADFNFNEPDQKMFAQMTHMAMKSWEDKFKGIKGKDGKPTVRVEWNENDYNTLVIPCVFNEDIIGENGLSGNDPDIMIMELVKNFSGVTYCEKEKVESVICMTALKYMLSPKDFEVEEGKKIQLTEVEYNYLSIVIHEIGHALGLDHPNENPGLLALLKLLPKEIRRSITVMETDSKLAKSPGQADIVAVKKILEGYEKPHKIDEESLYNEISKRSSKKTLPSNNQQLIRDKSEYSQFYQKAADSLQKGLIKGYFESMCKNMDFRPFEKEKSKNEVRDFIVEGAVLASISASSAWAGVAYLACQKLNDTDFIKKYKLIGKTYKAIPNILDAIAKCSNPVVALQEFISYLAFFKSGEMAGTKFAEIMAELIEGNKSLVSFFSDFKKEGYNNTRAFIYEYIILNTRGLYDLEIAEKFDGYKEGLSDVLRKSAEAVSEPIINTLYFIGKCTFSVLTGASIDSDRPNTKKSDNSYKSRETSRPTLYHL